ncbi:MAG: glycoside hydrolase family 9 protein [Lachnospiraceae bacterium]|nr:glycoside hydrolase family 9 protein [Lachnospiraceae bacterium]
MEQIKRKKWPVVLIAGAVLLLIVGILVLFLKGKPKGADDKETSLTPPVMTEMPTEAPTSTPKATATPKPTSTPRPTVTPKATAAPEPLPANNVVKNAVFDSDVSGWGLYKESGGEGTVSVENGQLALTITSLGTLNYAVQIYPEDIITLEQGREYRIRYEISSTEKRSIEVMIQQNGGSYQTYSWKKVDLKPEPQRLDYTFTMTSPTDANTKLVFNCGTQGNDLPEHTIFLDNVAVSVVDNSDYGKKPEEYEPAIRVNQVGYGTDSGKKAVFCDLVGATQFSVVNAQTEEVAYTGEIGGEKYTSSVNEINSFGDFSAVRTAGRYYISAGGVKSPVFEIGNTVYDTMLADMIKMFYLQRCGCDISDATFGHAACHTGQAKIYGTEEYIDVSGGWHDAGDYGRYIVPAAKTVADLLYAYGTMQNSYNDSIGIPESGNGIPDLLDEVRYELEWMLKMQAADGGVHHKVSCAQFPGSVMPEKETGQLIVTPVSTTATADFCAAMAMAYEFYYDIDRDFAENCLAAAERAWIFLEEHPELIFKNPSGIGTGSYEDTSDKDERYWAAAQMYRATKEEKYRKALEAMPVKEGLDWRTVGDYGNIALVTMKNIEKTSTIYTRAYQSIISQATRFAKTSASNTYGTAISSFHWGSNMTVSNAGVILGLAYELTGEENYLTAAQTNKNYLLGINPIGICFVTGYGTVSPMNPHHRPSMVMKQAVSGMLVGGVNSGLEDPTAKAKLKNVPTGKRYLDHKESYSTNEIAIYWNSPLVYLLALTDGK